MNNKKNKEYDNCVHRYWIGSEESIKRENLNFTEYGIVVYGKEEEY